MPRVLFTFANGIRSHGDGFVKTFSSGMWQCTLMTDTLQKPRDECAALEKNHQTGDTQSRSVAASKAFMRPEEKMPTLPKKGETIFFYPCPLPLQQQFYIFFSGSRYRCKILFLARPDSMTEVEVVRLEKLPLRAGLSDCVGSIFAKNTEATWADVLLFMRQLSPTDRRATGSSQTAVWQLQAVDSTESGVDDGAASFWRIKAALPLINPVQLVFVEDETVHLAVVTTREEALFTPPDCVVPEAAEPPPLLPKQTPGEASLGALPQRDLLAAFTEAMEDEGRAEIKTEVGAAVTTGAATNGQFEERAPTYAEVLVRGVQERKRGMGLVNESIHKWCSCFIELQNKLSHATSVEAMLRIAKSCLAQHEEQEKQRLQQQQHVAIDHDERNIAFLLEVGIKEMVCDLLFDVAASWAAGGGKARGVASHLRKCVDVARALGNELAMYKEDVVPALRFPRHILQLRLARHQCCALKLLGKPARPELLRDALRVGGRLLALLPACWRGGAACTGSVGSDGVWEDCSLKQFICGVLAAALSLLEMSFFVKTNCVLQDDVTWTVGSLLLWLRDATGGFVSIPVALAARVEGAACGRLKQILQRCEERPPAQPQKAPAAAGGGDVGTVVLCCGLVRAVRCSALLDQHFARFCALFRRVRAVGGVTGCRGTEISKKQCEK